MPIGGMTLVPLWDEISRVKSVRKTITDEEKMKLTIIRNHFVTDKYCKYLIRVGKIERCEDPQPPKIAPEKVIEYHESHYVYPINSDPYKLWDFSGMSGKN